MYSITEIRNGTKIEISGEPFVVTWFQHVNPGKGSAFVRTKLKSLITGNVVERTFKAGEKIPKADLEERKMQFLYRDGDNFNFMDMETYEQISLTEEIVGDRVAYLKDGMEVSILFHNERAIGIDVPFHVELKVTHCEPGIKGDTVSNVTKPATVETGAVFQVPLFVEEGDVIKVDTRTGQYIERSKG